jgi:hypothetical protein
VYRNVRRFTSKKKGYKQSEREGETDTALVNSTNGQEKESKRKTFVIFVVPTAVLLKTQVFWSVTPCRFVISYRRCGASWHLRLRDQAVREGYDPSECWALFT